MGDAVRAGRLRWLSRRGMKELDLLLDAFITRNAAALDRGEWPEFETLLATEDDVLWDWFQDPELARPKALRELVHEIRNGRAAP